MNTETLTKGSVGKTITAMTLPLVGGIYAMITFTLADTYFVAQLGTSALAAISFTFPVSMVLIYFVLGVGVGTASVVSRAIGRNDHHQAARLATDGLFLGIIFVIIETSFGLATIEPLFGLLGAQGETLELIRQYMNVWYIAIAFFIVSMIANSIVRATGDTKFPGMVMIISALINLILDPILIFGYFGLPAFGIKGAAMATLIAFAISAIALLIKQFQYRLITFDSAALRDKCRSWSQILYIGLPSGLKNVIIHTAIAFIIRLLSEFDETAVAGFGIAIKIEELALAIFYALNGAIVPFVGQNWGAKNNKRIHQGVNMCIRFCIFAGLLFTVILGFLGKPVARIFDESESVILVASLYMIIVPITYGVRGAIMVITASLNALGKPIPGIIISFIRTFVLYIPLAYIGKTFMGVFGIFAAAFFANLITGIGTLVWNNHYLKRLVPTINN